MNTKKARKPVSRLSRLKARVARWEIKVQRGDTLQQRRRAKLALLKKRLKAMTVLVAQVLLMTSSAPRLTPGEAARTLAASSPDLHVAPGSVYALPIPIRLNVMVPAPKPAPRPEPYRPRIIYGGSWEIPAVYNVRVIK
jgi:hypothetical protein